MDVITQNEKRKVSFYTRFSEHIISQLNYNSVLDQLYGRGILSREQRYEQIKDMGTMGNRRKFCELMEATDYKNVAILVEIIEDVSGNGLLDLVQEMKKFLAETRTGASNPAGPPSAASDLLRTASAAASDLNFEVSHKMVTPITRIMTDNDQAVLHWSRLYPELAPNALDKAKIGKLLKDEDTIHEAIRYTLQIWVAQACGTFQDLLDILGEHNMNDLVKELKSKASAIKSVKK